jgi:fermentation-respiration switch protein FrsA (DUF1100 family)
MKGNIGEDGAGDARSAVARPNRPPNRWRGWLWRTAQTAAIAYLVVVLGMTFIETWLVYPIPPNAESKWTPHPANREDVWFTSADGTKLFGWFAAGDSPRRAILYCHGNGEDISNNAKLLDDMTRELDAAVFMLDYRGYGRSEGRPTEAGCVEDGLAAQRCLADRMGLKTNEIVVMGRSLGAAIAVAVAAKQGAQALVLDSTFSRMTDAAAVHYPWLPVRLVMQNRYDSVARIRRYFGPLFQAHGTADSIVPIELGRELFAAAPGSTKQFREYPGRDHNDPIPETFLAEVKVFLDRLPDKADMPSAGNHP